ncbi:MAG: MFS transporter [Oscillospiraceae bacterium]|nr:MFS transporter [Oscillospiraceae bacterium]
MIKEKLKFNFILRWSSTSVSMGMSGMLMMHFAFYATDTVGLDPGLVGVLILVSRLLDAAIGIIAGFVVDRTRTRFGKGRHYDLFLLPMWFCVVLLFSTPDFGMTGRIIYVFAFYSLATSVLTTLAHSGQTAYMGRAIPDDHDRAKVTSVSAVLVMLVCSIGSIAFPQLMTVLGSQHGGWRVISLVYALPMCAIGVLRFFTVKEKQLNGDSDENQRIGAKEGLRVIFRNKYIFILAAAGMLCNITMTVTSTVTTYFFTYIIGDLGLMSFVGIVGFASPLVLLMFPAAIRTIGGMNFVRIGLVLAIAGNLIKLISIKNIPLLVAAQLFANIGLSAFMMMTGYFLLQVIDHGERKFGKRVEGLSSAVSGLFGKIGGGLASLLVGGLMGLAGYVNLSAEQPAAALNAVTALYSWIPAVFCTLILISLHFYDLDKKRKD